MPRQGFISLIALGLCLSGFYDCIKLPLPPHLDKGGQLQFLTTVSLLFTIIYITLSQLFPTNRHLKTIYNIACNLEFNVTVSYWAMRVMFPNSLNTESFERNVWLDLRIHLIPYLYLIVFDSYERISANKSIGYTVGVLLGYWGYLEYIMYVHGHDGVPQFTYPFLQHKTVLDRFIRIVGLMLLSVLNYFVLGIRNSL